MKLLHNKKYGILFLILIISSQLLAEDYQYQYFNRDKKKHTPFSAYIPRHKLHMRSQPHFLEDYYLLYGMPLYYNENSLRVNIKRLKTALNSRFRHPSKALIKINNAKEYLKYRRLLYMHINILIMRSYLKIAVRYDKRRLYFYDSEYKKHILDSLDIAEKIYKQALPYWKKAKYYAKTASKVKITLNLGFIESERFSIITGSLDYGDIIKNYLSRVNKKKKKLSGSM